MHLAAAILARTTAKPRIVWCGSIVRDRHEKTEREKERGVMYG